MWKKKNIEIKFCGLFYVNSHVWVCGRIEGRFTRLIWILWGWNDVRFEDYLKNRFIWIFGKEKLVKNRWNYKFSHFYCKNFYSNIDIFKNLLKSFEIFWNFWIFSFFKNFWKFIEVFEFSEVFGFVEISENLVKVHKILLKFPKNFLNRLNFHTIYIKNFISHHSNFTILWCCYLKSQFSQ